MSVKTVNTNTNLVNRKQDYNMTITYSTTATNIWKALGNDAEVKAIKKARFNLNSLASKLEFFTHECGNYNCIEENYPYTLAELKILIIGDSITICAQSFALEKIEKLEQILNNIKN